MTKKELLEAIKDMPEDAEVKVTVRMANGGILVASNLHIEKYGNRIVISNDL